MKTERISYSESVESANEWGLKSWKKFSVDILMEEGDSDEDGRKKAVQIVKDGLSGFNGSQYYTSSEQGEIIKTERESIVPIPKEDRIDAMISLINSPYQTKKTIENLKPKVEAENNKELTQAYQQKLKEFN